MVDDGWQEADALFEQALELPSDERAEFLGRCPDRALRERVARLLKLAARAEDFLLPGEPMEMLGDALSDDATRELPVHFAIGDLLAGRYRIEERLGEGGMGVVFRARDMELGREVAVKVVRGQWLDRQGHERLIREARAAAALNHANVVTIHDIGEEGGLPFLVMEFVAGPTAEERIPETVEAIVEYARQVALALAHAHERGVVHRDLKPGNLMVTTEGTEVRIKLADLGLALARKDPRITRAGRILGTPSYMAPEQALGQDVDGRVDLYALGVMLYQWSTGRLPFIGDDALAVVSQQIHAPLVPPRTLRPDLPAALDAVICRLLAKDPSRRYRSATELAVALDTMDDREDSERAPAIAGLVRGRLVGREEELGRVREAWARAAAGAGRLMLISGEAGAGKSRLAKELAASVRLDDGQALWGGSYEYEAATPYLPFVEAIRGWVRHQHDESGLRRRLQGIAPELARLAPEIDERLGPFDDRVELSPGEERLKLFDHVARFFRRLAGSKGLLVCLDDLQWADQGSLNLLHYCLRQLGGDRVLFLGIYREGEATANELDRIVADWNRERLCDRIHLGRLDDRRTGQMLSTLLGGAPVSDGFASTIFRETEGNPFFIEEVVKALIEDGQLCRHEDAWEMQRSGELVLPEGIRATVGRRLERVGKECTDLLRVAALLGKVFRFADLLQVADSSEDSLLDSLDEAAAAQLVSSDELDRFCFTHDKIREYLIVEQNPIRRRRLHGKIARGLETLSRSDPSVAIEDLAHHFTEAGDHTQGMRYAIESARAASDVFAHDEALVLYRRALASAEVLNSPEDRLEIESAMGQVNWQKGECVVAARQFESALAAHPTTDRREALLSRAAEAYCQVGDPRGNVLADQVLKEADPERNPVEVGRAMMVRGRFLHYLGDPDQAVGVLQQALDLFEKGGAAPERIRAWSFLAGAFQHAANFDESDRWARLTLAAGEADRGMAAMIGLEFLAENAENRGRWTEAIAYAEREAELAERTRATERRAWASWCRGTSLRGLGHLRQALTVYEETRELCRRIEERRLGLFVEFHAAVAMAELGLLDQALERILAATQAADATELHYHRAEARHMAAYVRILRGEFDEALPLALEFGEILAGTGERCSLLTGGGTAIEALLMAGRLDEAASRLVDYEALVMEAGAGYYEGRALRARAMLRSRQDDRDAACADLVSAVEIFEANGARFELARTFDQRASIFREQGKETEAEADLRRAEELYEACRADPPE